MGLPSAPDDYPLPPSLTSSWDDLVAVTPSDTVALPFRCRGLWVGGAGDVTVLAKDGVTAVAVKNVPAGTQLNGRVSYVKATGTTATFIVAFR